jgi:hypothetical protein
VLCSACCKFVHVRACWWDAPAMTDMQLILNMSFLFRLLPEEHLDQPLTLHVHLQHCLSPRTLQHFVFLVTTVGLSSCHYFVCSSCSIARSSHIGICTNWKGSLSKLTCGAFPAVQLTGWMFWSAPAMTDMQLILNMSFLFRLLPEEQTMHH